MRLKHIVGSILLTVVLTSCQTVKEIFSTDITVDDGPKSCEALRREMIYNLSNKNQTAGTTTDVQRNRAKEQYYAQGCHLKD